MRWLWVFLTFLQSTLLFAQSSPPQNPPVPPSPAVATPAWLPLVFVNDSGLSADQINIIIKGRTLNNPSAPAIIHFNPSTGYGTLVPVNIGDNTQTYNLTLSQFPQISGQPDSYYLYSPEINSAAIWFSIGAALDIPVIADGNNAPGFQDPNFLSPTDPNYNTLFDIFEYTYGTNLDSVGADSTAVSFFSLPLYGYISTKTNASLSNSGLYESRSSVIANMQQYFNDASSPENSQWNHLLLKNGSGDILRVASTGKGTTTPSTAITTPFDINYLDNEQAYGYSYIADIWSGQNAFYKTHTLTLQIPGGRIYSGTVDGNNQFVFHAEDSSGSVTLSPPTKNPYPTTSQAIFAGIDMQDQLTFSQDGVQVSKLFQEAIVVGAIPTTETISESSLTANQANFYTRNPLLTGNGQTTGPWYDLYSKALHSYAINTGTPQTSPTIYSFAYDDAMWPQVLISSQHVTQSPLTYLGVTLGKLSSSIVTSQVALTSSLNPSAPGQVVTFTATVTGSSGGIPTGTVTFTVDGVVGSPIVLNGSAQASFSTSTLSSGQHQILANYSGDATFPSSVSAPLQQVIGVPTTTALTSSLNPANVGNDIVFTATITPSTKVGKLSGTVTFSFNGTVQAVIPVVNGRASYTTSKLAAGVYEVAARYSGTDVYHSSVSPSLTQSVGGNLLTATENPSQLGDSVIFTYTIISNKAIGLPTGAVTFNIDGTDVATVNVQNSAASYKTSALSIGDHSVIARYSGDRRYPARTSSTLIQHVVDYDPVTDVVLTSSSNPAQKGTAITFTATVVDVNNDKIPNGTVTFSIDSILGKPINLVDGKAQFEISSLSVGAHTIIAFYAGNAEFKSSGSDPLTQVVVAGPGDLVSPPRDVKIKQVKNRFATQIDVVNVIRWKSPSSGATPVAYEIYANAKLTKLIAKVNAAEKTSSHQKKFKYEDHNRKKERSYHYFIVSVDASGHRSEPIEVSL